MSVFPQFSDYSLCDVVCLLILLALVSIILGQGLINIKVENDLVLSVERKSMNDVIDDQSKNYFEAGPRNHVILLNFCVVMFFFCVTKIKMWTYVIVLPPSNYLLQ